MSIIDKFIKNPPIVKSAIEDFNKMKTHAEDSIIEKHVS